MDTVGADEHVGRRVKKRRSVSFGREAGDDLISSPRLEADQTVSQVNAVRAQALPYDLKQGQLQLAAMDGYLRPVITCLKAAGFAPDALALPVEIDQFAGLNADVEKWRHGAELIQHTDAMRKQVDANAERLYLSGSFEYVDVQPGAIQRQGCHQAADSTSDDQEFHARKPLESKRPRRSMTNPVRGSESGRIVFRL